MGLIGSLGGMGELTGQLSDTGIINGTVSESGVLSGIIQIPAIDENSLVGTAKAGTAICV